MNIFIGVLFAVVFSIWLWKRRHFYFVSTKLPGPISFPIVGSIFHVIELIRSKEPLKVLWKARNHYSGLYRGWFGPDLYLIVIDPEDMESMASSKIYGKSLDVQFWWKSAMGNGLVTKSGEEIFADSWKEHKKIINPFMGNRMSKIYFEILREKLCLLDEDFNKISNQGSVEINMIVERFCAEAIMGCLFDVDIRFRHGARDGVFMALIDIMSVIVRRTIFFWNRLTPILERSEMGKRQKEGTKVLRELAEEIFNMNIEKNDKNGYFNEDSLEPCASAVLMKSYYNKDLSANQVIEEFMNIFSAARSAATGVKFAILSLAINKDCQTKAFNEIKKFYKNDKNATIEFEHLNSFPYLDMCLKESLRLFCTGPITTRYSIEDFEFKSRNLIIPKGTTFILSSFLTHRDPNQWPDPEKYIPERFTDKEIEKRHPYSYVPFGVGPRKCLGRPFAQLVINVCLINLLKKFEFHSDWKIEEIPLNLDVDIRSEWGYKVRVTERNWE